MSFQYIRPYMGYNIQNWGVLSKPTMSYAQANITNPYTTSIYNQPIYPYNPWYNQFSLTNQKPYKKLGTLPSLTGDFAHIFQLDNGQKVAIMPRKNEATIVKTFVDAGSMNETDEKRGLMHVIEHGLFKGAKNLKDGDVFKYTSQMGASTNASTDYALVAYYILAPYMSDENLKRAIQIQGDMISNPTFDEAAMTSEKEPICSEISMINDDPLTKGFDRAIRNLFEIKSTSENMVAGSIDTVKALETQDMHQYHETYYKPQNLYTVVIGVFDVEKTMDLIAENFKTKTTVNPAYHVQITPTQKATREDIISSKTNASHAILAFSGPRADNAKDFIVVQMLNHYIAQHSSSKFKSDLEKINANYDYTLQKVGLNQDDPYALISLISTNAKEEQQGLDAFYDIIEELQTKPLNDEDIETLKKLERKSSMISMDDSENLCDLLGNSMIDNSLEMFVNYNDLINSVTKEDIMAAARKYYNLNKASIVVVHPNSVTEEDIKKNWQNSKYSAKNSVLSFKGNLNVSTKSVFEDILDNNTHLALNSSKSELCVFSWSVYTPPIKPKNPNIPEVLRYMFEKGSDFKSQKDFERFKEKHAIDTSVYVNGRSIEISANCLPEKKEETLSLMNELMYRPRLTQKDFEDAKKYVKDVLKASQKDVSGNLLNKLYPGYFATDSNKLATIDELTLDDIKEFYIELLKNASSAFVANVNDNERKQTVDIIRKYQNKENITFKNSTPKLSGMFTPEVQRTVVYDVDDLNQAQIYKSYKFPLSGNIQDEIKFELLNTILGASPSSRLFSDLRTNKNLAYSVSSSIQSFENTGILTLKIQTTTDNPEAGIESFDNVQKSLEGFQLHTDRLQQEYVTDDELNAAKTKLKQQIAGQFQNPLSQNALLAMNIMEPYGIKRIDEYVKAIDSITKEDILQAANHVFSYNPTISILASENTINSQMPYLQTQGVIQKAS
ncbi:insulinase family protein [bacterium]|nr:insulinase family protein [bacterium]